MVSWIMNGGGPLAERAAARFCSWKRTARRAVPNQAASVGVYEMSSNAYSGKYSALIPFSSH
jgi:hypothetical protein